MQVAPSMEDRPRREWKVPKKNFQFVFRDPAARDKKFSHSKMQVKDGIVALLKL